VLDLQPRDDERPRAIRAEEEGDRPLGGCESEARAVEDVVRIEEHDAGKAVHTSPLEQLITARAVLVGRDGDRRDHGRGAYRRASA